MLSNTMQIFKKYRFLLKQLILRDFKVKYKRSYLGVVWSLLYPLLMMTVLTIVFSNVFKVAQPGVNYLVYLLTGLIVFQYVSEASNLAMGSITSNGHLINKLYIPKYIFTISKPLFIGINFLLTLIPLFLIILFTGQGDTKTLITIHYLLLPVSFLFIFVFTLGLSFILATINVFFRDMVYIYGIITTVWMYLTPIMYDVSIIPDKFLAIYKLNPLYWLIKFMRDIILMNKVPDIITWIACIAFSFAFLFIGLFIFKRKQARFIYYL